MKALQLLAIIIVITTTLQAQNGKSSSSHIPAPSVLDGAWKMIYDNVDGKITEAKDQPLKLYVLSNGFWMWFGPDSSGKWNEGGAGTYQIEGNIWKQKAIYSFDPERVGYLNWSKFELRNDTLLMQNYIKMFYKDKDETKDFPKRNVKWVRIVNVADSH